MYIFLLHAHRNDFEHKLIEMFTSMELLELFLTNHPEVSKDEITLHEVNPT